MRIDDIHGVTLLGNTMVVSHLHGQMVCSNITYKWFVAIPRTNGLCSNSTYKWFVWQFHVQMGCGNYACNLFVATLRTNGLWQLCVQTICGNSAYKWFVATLRTNGLWQLCLQMVLWQLYVQMVLWQLYVQMVCGNSTHKWFVRLRFILRLQCVLCPTTSCTPSQSLPSLFLSSRDFCHFLSFSAFIIS